MRLPLVFSATAVLGLSSGTLFGDSVNPPEPVEAAPVQVSSSAAAPAPSPAPVAPKASGEPAAARPAPQAETADCVVVDEPPAKLEPTVVRASEAPASPLTQANSPYTAPVVATPRNVTYQPVPGRFSRQVISAYYVNRVSVQLPAGIKVTTRKDWYAKNIVVTYLANPYTNWRGVTPDALAFRHVGTTMEIIPSGTKYVPTEIVVTVPSPVEVIVR